MTPTHAPNNLSCGCPQLQNREGGKMPLKQQQQCKTACFSTWQKQTCNLTGLFPFMSSKLQPAEPFNNYNFRLSVEKLDNPCCSLLEFRETKVSPSLALWTRNLTDHVKKSLQSTFGPMSTVCKDLFCPVSSPVAPGMLPGFPPGIFPFWGPFPAVPPPPAAAVAAPGGTDAPQSSTEATQTAGKNASCSPRRKL